MIPVQSHKRMEDRFPRDVQGPLKAGIPDTDHHTRGPVALNDPEHILRGQTTPVASQFQQGVVGQESQERTLYHGIHDTPVHRPGGGDPACIIVAEKMDGDDPASTFHHQKTGHHGSGSREKEDHLTLTPRGQSPDPFHLIREQESPFSADLQEHGHIRVLQVHRQVRNCLEDPFPGKGGGFLTGERMFSRPAGPDCEALTRLKMPTCECRRFLKDHIQIPGKPELGHPAHRDDPGNMGQEPKGTVEVHVRCSKEKTAVLPFD